LLSAGMSQTFDGECYQTVHGDYYRTVYRLVHCRSGLRQRAEPDPSLFNTGVCETL